MLVRMSLFDPVVPDPQPLATFGTFAPTVSDRLFMARVIEKFYKIETSINTLGVFPVENYATNSN